jgi:hypothetical protein
MSEKGSDKEESTLSPEQRLDALEATVGTNKLGLMIIALVILVGISIAITSLIMVNIGDDDKNADKSLRTLQTQMDEHIGRLDELSEQLILTSEKVNALDGSISNSSNKTLRRILLEQEISNQQFIDAAKGAIYDLAHMVPGSRGWLELYNEQLDQAQEQSAKRQDILKQLNTSKTVDTDSSGFSENF